MEIAKGAMFYGSAMGFVERNQDGGEVLTFLEEIEIGTFSAAETILYSERLVQTDLGRQKQREAGFKTTRGTKSALVGRLKEFMHDLKLPEPGAPYTLCPFDLNTVLEAMKYVYKSPSAAPGATKREGAAPTGASEGHDDDVISECLCLFARRILLPDLPTLPTVKPRQTQASRYFDMLYKLETAGRADAGWIDPAMGPEF
jgi:hypothetical protein